MDASLFLLAIIFLQHTMITAQKPSSWLTLSGEPPAIIANGGFSGLFPGSSYYAYIYALTASSSATILLCDVRLTKDGTGICLPDLKLDNCTDISQFYAQGQRSYLVNGVNMTGWFTVDYNTTQLSSISLTQSIYSRTYRFDASRLDILSVDDVVKKTNATSLWLNIQHDSFYGHHNLNMTSYVLSVTRRVPVNYISSPELSFLSGIRARFSSSKTKLIFRFLDKNIVEPSTKATYGSLLSNLTFIKSVAAGILVPKTYIWPVTSDNYLLPFTSIVADAHKAGLEIHAADFANDNSFSYNYSYDPLAEVLSYVDNKAFSVDGIVSDFPITPSEAIECYVDINKSSTNHAIISRPFSQFPDTVRNPRYKNSGNFMRLSDFLAFAKSNPLAGVLISVENVEFMLEQLGYNVIDGVVSALNEAGYDNTSQKIMIQSTSSSVLVRFKQETEYKLVYKINEIIGDVDASSLADIKKFAHAVVVDKDSIFPTTYFFTTNRTDVVAKFQKAGLEVYAYVFQNEFVGQPWDFFSDATAEINEYVEGVGVDGIITEFPATAGAYKRNSCKKLGTKSPAFMRPVKPGGLMQLLTAQAMPPTLPPSPTLNASDALEPPLPSLAWYPSTGEIAAPPANPSSGFRRPISLFISVALLCASPLLA